MGLRIDVGSPCENTWTGRHTNKCGHDLDAQPRERNDGVMDMTYPELEREPLFDDRFNDDEFEDAESGTGETFWHMMKNQFLMSSGDTG